MDDNELVLTVFVFNMINQTESTHLYCKAKKMDKK